MRVNCTRDSMLPEFLCHLVSLSFCNGLYVTWVSMSPGLTSVMYVSLCCPSSYVTWFHFRSVMVSMLSEFLCHLVSLPLCMDPCVAWVSMSLGLVSIKYGSCVVWISISLGLTSVMYVSLCCPSFYLTWSHFCYERVSMFSEFLCHLVSFSFYMGPCIAWVSMSLCLTSVLYVSLFCPSFYVTWYHFLSVWVSMLSEFLCHLVSLPLCMGSCVFWVSISIGLGSIIYESCVVCVSMSLGLTFVLYESLCYRSFYVTWSRFYYIWVLCCLSFCLLV